MMRFRISEVTGLQEMSEPWELSRRKAGPSFRVPRKYFKDYKEPQEQVPIFKCFSTKCLHPTCYCLSQCESYAQGYVQGQTVSTFLMGGTERSSCKAVRKLG